LRQSNTGHLPARIRGRGGTEWSSC
jgi:hypothetical protein